MADSHLIVWKCLLWKGVTLEHIIRKQWWAHCLFPFLSASARLQKHPCRPTEVTAAIPLHFCLTEMPLPHATHMMCILHRKRKFLSIYTLEFVLEMSAGIFLGGVSIEFINFPPFIRLILWLMVDGFPMDESFCFSLHLSPLFSPMPLDTVILPPPSAR